MRRLAVTQNSGKTPQLQLVGKTNLEGNNNNCNNNVNSNNDAVPDRIFNPEQ